MRNPFKWVVSTYKKLNKDIWKTPLSRLTGVKAWLIRQIRIVYLLNKGIKKDAIYIKAAGLTFFTILSVVPLFALAFGIAKGFDLQEDLRAEIIKQFHNQEQVMLWILDFANNALAQTRGGWLAGIGVAVLFYTVGQLLRYVESIFNSFWNVENTRVWYRQLTDYLAMILLVPVIFIASSSVTVFANTRLNEFMSRSEMLEELKPLVTFLIQLIPFILMFLLTTAAYLAMPNTRVKIRSALTAGVLTGIALQFIQILYIQLQVGASKLGALYGSFAAVPLMMIWVQMSWVVVLLGAQLSFYLQNITRYEYEFDVQNVSQRQKKRLSLLILHTLIKDFIKGTKPRSPEEISLELSIPIRTVRDSLDSLCQASLVTELYNEARDHYLYQPALDVNRMTLFFVMDRLDNSGSTHKTVINNSDYRKIDTALSKLETMIANSESNVLLRDM